jgi:hypothetical protein
MSASAVERKYALTKVATGDYLLPSNDATTVWRIASYVDGPSNGLEIPRDRTFWGLWQWPEPIGPGCCVDTGSWDRWDMWDGLYDTRAQAIAAALKEKREGGREGVSAVDDGRESV